jgi:vancomycin resistance protein YoaR
MAINLTSKLKRSLPSRSHAADSLVGDRSVEPVESERDTQFDTAELPILDADTSTPVEDIAASDAGETLPHTTGEDAAPASDIETTDAVEAVAPASATELAEPVDAPADNAAETTADALEIVELAPDGGAAVDVVDHRPDTRHADLMRFALYTRAGAIAVIGLLLAVVIGFQFAERDEVRAGVHAFGVDLSGMTRDDARAALLAETERQRQATFTLTDSKGEWTLTTADLGLSMDVDRAVDEAFAEGRSGWGAGRLSVVWHLRSEADVVGTDTIGVQGDLLDAKLANLQQAIHQTKVDPVLTLSTETGASYTRHVIGRDLDVDATRNAILTALTYGETDAELVVTETPPAAYDTDYAAVRKQLDNLYNGDIKLTTPVDYWTMQPLQITNWLTVVPPANGQPAALQINEEWVDEVVWDITVGTDSQPRSPRIWWGENGGFVKTADGSPGLDLIEDQARPLIHSVFLGEQDMNEVPLPVAEIKTPELPADLNTLGIAYPLASSSIPYGGGLPERAHNIELAARLLNGTVVMPGQTFSFNAEIGDMTVDAGFQVAYGIATENGQTITIPAEAGGICQVSTTVFQPVFSTGYQIDQRGWHAYWIPRYAYNGMVAMDATVEPTVGQDFKWTNNSSTAVLIEAYADGEDFTVQLYGTAPNWRVEIDQPVITNERPADQKIVYEPSDTIPVGSTRSIEHAQDGFDASITRRVIQGDQVNEEVFWSSYAPARNVVLVGSADGTLPAGYAD